MSTETKYSTYCKDNVGKIITEINRDNSIVGTVTRKAFSKVAEDFWHVPASSTGKYHPLYACGDAGLARHTLAAVHFAERFIISDNIDKVTGAYVKAALLLHDTCKLGVNFEARYTLFEHPILVFLLLSSAELTQEEYNVWVQLNNLISSHMGIWCSPTERDRQYNMNRIMSNFEKVGLCGPNLPIPTSDIQKLVARCDYLAADKECMLTMFESQKGAWKDVER